MSVRLPGIPYADIDQTGRPHGVLHFPHGDGLLRGTRCSRQGRLLAGITQHSPTVNRDEVWELDIARGVWRMDSRVPYGPGSVIYRGEELLVWSTPPAHGYRYLAPDGTPVDRTSTYAHPHYPVWEYTVLPNGWVVGQGGKGPWGEDPLVILPMGRDGAWDGTRRLVARGMCRWINAYLVDGRVLLAWQQDGRDSDARALSTADVLGLEEAPWTPDPIVVPPPPPPPPPDDDVEPTVMMLPADVHATFVACVRKFPHTGSDDDRRGAMRKAVQTLRARHGERWVWKSEHGSEETGSKDALGYVPSGPIVHLERTEMYIWDMINGTTREPKDAHESEPLRRAYVLAVPAQDWLVGTGEPPPPPPPPPDGDLAREVAALKSELAIQRSMLSLGLEKIGAALEDHKRRLTLLEHHTHTPTLPPLVARGRVGFSDVLNNRTLEWVVEPKE